MESLRAEAGADKAMEIHSGILMNPQLSASVKKRSFYGN